MKRTLYTLILSVIYLTAAQAQIYSYTNSTTGAYNAVATNATGLGLARYQGATAPGSPCGTGFSSTNFSSTATYNTTVAAIEADVTAAAGYMLSVTGFSAGLRRSGTGPASARLAYSTDGGTTWIDKGSNDAPNNASCGSTTTATWTTAFTVPSTSTLKFRIYAFNASGTSGTMQILNLDINGTVITTDSIFTTATTFGPFCAGVPDTISLPFTQSGGGFTDSFQVQLSDASGIFPNDATSNIISTGSTTSPVQAIIPSTTAWGNGYRVRVVNASPTFYSSGDNGSNIVLNQSVTPSFSILALSSTSICSGSSLGFTSASVTNGGTSPLITWYLNGANTGTTGTLYSSSTFQNNDSVYATLVSNAACAVPTTVSSTKIGVTVYPTVATTIYDTACPGGSMSFGGRTVSSSGVYYDTLSTVHSCDSIITLHFSVKTLHSTNIPVAICQGDSFTWQGHTYHTATTVSDTLRCDSIVTLTLTYKTVSRVNVPAAICTGGSYTWHGISYNAAGSYSDTVRCDSIVTLVLTVHSLPAVTWTPADTVICSNLQPITLLTGGSPSGGLYSGSYVSSDTFYDALLNTRVWIKYTYSDNNQCSNSDSVLFSAFVCGGIAGIDLSSTISIYPNPTDNKIHIDAASLRGESTITLTDMMGKVIFTQTSSAASLHQDLDLSGYEKGIYLLSLRDSSGMGTKQVMKY